jgi:outer membrane protein OmpA-like peptidoglycan-associated protein
VAKEAAVAHDAPAPTKTIAAPAATDAPAPALAAPAPPAPTGPGFKGTNFDPSARDANLVDAQNGVLPVAYTDATTKLFHPSPGGNNSFRHFLAVLRGQGFPGHFTYAWGKELYPVSLTFELPQRYQIHQVGMVGGGKLVVEGSVTGPNAGFYKLGEWTAEAKETPQEFPVGPTEARWLRYTLPSPATTRITAFIAKGPRAEDRTAHAVDLTGTWKTDWPDGRDWWPAATACFEQKGTAVRGILVRSDRAGGLEYKGLVEGGLLVVGTNGGSVGALVIHDGAEKLAGLVPHDPLKPLDRDKSTPWWFTKSSDRIECKGFGSAAEEKSKLEAELEKGGRSAVYGVLFDFDKDTIKEAESKPVLDEVVGLLKKQPTWKLSIEGHTDAEGQDAYNLDLSKRRAAAVVKWLTTAGIDAKRLGSQGFGKTKPVASNDTAAGRALNRRVELVKR